MKSVQSKSMKIRLIQIVAVITTVFTFQIQTVSASVYDALSAQMEDACPIVWEDLGVAISSNVPAGDVWQGDTVDRAGFVAQYTAANPSVSSQDIENIADSTDAVAAECAAYRISLLDALLAQTPIDVAAALVAANNSSSGDYLGTSWYTGDVRVTGRAAAATGWVFLTGQTVGSNSSTASLQGDEYFELFELAKTWAPNVGTEDWATGNIVTLPDMRGRTMSAPDNMGGVSANVITNVASDQLGGEFGTEQQVLTTNQMPSHTHSMDTKGDHGHSVGYAGTHGHNIRTSVYAGSSVPGYGTYFEGKGRPGYQSTKSAPVRSAGNHQHSLGNAGDHTHSNTATGGSDPIGLAQPSIVFNVEMKL